LTVANGIKETSDNGFTKKILNTTNNLASAIHIDYYVARTIDNAADD
jgi:hypothetical protein